MHRRDFIKGIAGATMLPAGFAHAAQMRKERQFTTKDLYINTRVIEKTCQKFHDAMWEKLDAENIFPTNIISDLNVCDDRHLFEYSKKQRIGWYGIAEVEKSPGIIDVLNRTVPPSRDRRFSVGLAIDIKLSDLYPNQDLSSFKYEDYRSVLNAVGDSIVRRYLRTKWKRLDGYGYSSHFTSIKISPDCARSEISELGKKGPYLRHVNFPIEVIQEI